MGNLIKEGAFSAKSNTSMKFAGEQRKRQEQKRRQNAAQLLDVVGE